ncbi:MAG: tripartite tricarboxylate transporter permease [Bacteroidota bacterium]
MSQLLSWEGLLALLLGGLYGSLFGAIPGLTATLAVALFVPIAFFLDPAIALPAIIAISSVAIYAGDVGSAVARIPGTPASAAYADELYALSQRNGPIFGLGLSAMASSVGGILGTLFLMGSATGIAAIATRFSSFEYFWIAVLGLTAGIFASGGSPLKSMVSLFLGILFATVGVDPTLGYGRFHFGIPDLMGGLHYIVAMIGLFGFSEVLEFLYMGDQEKLSAPNVQGNASRAFFFQPLVRMRKKVGMILRSSTIGVFVGFLPGAGADIGAWVSSSIQKVQGKATPNASTQEEDIILAGTSSNNAAVASAWIPALSLGLPGDTVTAIVLGIFMMKGITPGPLLFEQQLPLIWTLFGTFLLANILLLPLYGFLTARLAAYLVRIPKNLLMSVIAVICLVGAFTINHSVVDIWIMMGMGLTAFFLKRGGFPLAQVVLGMVLGRILEQNFMVSAIKSKWDISSFFERPIALVLMSLTLLIIVMGLRVRKKHLRVEP